MKMRLLFFVAALLAAAIPAAEAQTLLWNRAVPGPAGQQTVLGDGRIVARSIALDRSGNVVVTGSMTTASGRDFLTTKISATGAIAWQQTFAGASGGHDDAMSVAVDGSGNAIVVGVSASTSSTDIKVIKYAASDGRVMWERSIDYGRAEGGYFVAVDASGNAFVASETTSATGNSDLRVAKLAAANGATQWDQVSDTGRDDFVSDIAADANGDVVVLGLSASATGGNDVRVLKFAGADGAQRWAQALNFGGIAGAYALALDAAGNVIVTGAAGTEANTNFRTFKLAASNGASAWMRDYDGGRMDQAQGVAADAAGNVFVTGQSQNAAGRYVLKTFKYAAASGAALWENTYDGGYNDYGYQVATDAAGNAVVVGSTTNAAGNTDWKVIVYANGNGDVLQQYTYAGAAGGNDDAYAVGFDAGGTVVGGLSLESGTTTVARVIKLSPVAAAAPPPTTPTTPPGASSNVALAANGAVASASSSYGPSTPASAVINGERAGAAWGNGGGWEDGTHNAFPDWVQVTFNGPKAIDRVVVYTLRDDVGNAAEPTDSTTFRSYGIVNFTVEGWDGSSWHVLGTVTGNNLVKRTVTFAAFTTDRIRVNVSQGLYFKSRIVEIEAWGVAASASAASNVALASAGAVASASSTYGPSTPVTAVNNNERSGAAWGNGGGWEDATHGAYPDWVQIVFNGAKTIDRVVVYTLRDDVGNPSEPADDAAFRSYGIVNFTVEGWNGSSWQALATVTGNNLVKRSVTFTPFTTDRVRVSVSQGLYFKSRIVEIEAWGVPASGAVASNVALASAGAMATASSTYGPGAPASAVIDNQRSGAGWGNGGGWEDATHAAYPDWVQVTFSGQKVIDRVVVYTLRDDIGNPAEPSDTQTFAAYGIVDFTVEGWNGSAWQALGSVTGNNLVKRTVSFPAFTTDRIRVNVTRANYFKSRIVEIEAWGTSAP